MKTKSNLEVRSKVLMASIGVVTAAVSLAPLSAYADASTTATTVSSAVGSSIGLLSSSGTVNVNVAPTSTGVQTIAKDTVTVSTNNSSGYNLKLNETSAVGTLTSGSDTIAASAGTFATPVVMAVNTWGYHVDGAGTFGTGGAAVSNQAIGAVKFAKVPATASPDTLKTTAAVANSDVTSVWYGVAANNSTASGTYTNSVTYTATTN